MKLLRRLGQLLVYLCIATVLATLCGLATLWFRGSLDSQRCQQILAVLYGMELQPVPASNSSRSADPQASYEQILERRAQMSLDADLREAGMEHALLGFHTLEQTVKREKQRVDSERRRLELLLLRHEKSIEQEGLQDLRKILESMSAEQAKAEILKMLQDGEKEKVVMIIKLMAPDKCSKLVAQFRDEPDAQIFHELLQQLASGAGRLDLLREARESLAQPLAPLRPAAK